MNIRIFSKRIYFLMSLMKKGPRRPTHKDTMWRDLPPYIPAFCYYALEPNLREVARRYRYLSIEYIFKLFNLFNLKTCFCPNLYIYLYMTTGKL